MSLPDTFRISTPPRPIKPHIKLVDGRWQATWPDHWGNLFSVIALKDFLYRLNKRPTGRPQHQPYSNSWLMT